MKYIIRIPINLNIDDILKEHPPKSKLKKEKLLYIIYLIYYTRFINVDNWYKCEWAILNAEYLKSIISNYKIYLDYLKGANVIESNNQYIAGERSRGYKLCSFAHMYWLSTKLELSDKTLINALRKLENKTFDNNKFVERQLNYLYVWFDDKLRIEFPGDAFDNYQKSQALKINDNIYRFKIDKFGKRLHTNLTNLKKEHREYLRYDNKPLISIDIKCSQPYLVIKLLLDEVSNTYPDVHLQLSNLNTNEEKTAYLNTLEKHDGLSSYINDVSLGRLYEVLGTGLKKKHGYMLLREMLKKVMYKIIFSKARYTDTSKKVFKKTYPFVNDVFNKSKRVHYKDLCKNLQRLESNLILNVICKEIAETNKDIPMFTIHDSIMTIPEHVDTVYNIMMNILTEAIGFTPTLDIENH